MENVNVKISRSAKKFIREHGIKDVCFNLIECDVAGCCIGMVKDIEPEYRAPSDAQDYRYFKVEDFYIFISRKIKILGPLKLTTEGLFNKKLSLHGAIPQI